jgi:hypothetical protein
MGCSSFGKKIERNGVVLTSTRVMGRKEEFLAMKVPRQYPLALVT